MDSSHSPSKCFDARTVPLEYGNGPLNPDVGGAATAIANIVINLLLPILVTWSEDVSTAVLLLYSQTYPVLVAICSSIYSENLSVYDAQLGINLAASPMCAYVVGCSILHALGVNTSLYAKLTSTETRRIIFLLGLALPWLWLANNVVLSFSTTAFKNSEHCAEMTIPRFLEFMIVSTFTGVLDVLGRRDLYDDLKRRGGLGLISLVVLWVYGWYLARHREEIIRLAKSAEETPFRTKITRVLPYGDRLISIYGRVRLIWRLPWACWTVVFKHHPWVFVVALGLLHWSWVVTLSKALRFDRDELSFGQVTSLFSIIPCIYGVYRILRKRRKGLFQFIMAYPRYLWEGIQFLIFGDGAQVGKGKTTVDSLSHSRRRERDHAKWTRPVWIMVIVGAIAINGLHAVWLRFYVAGGTRPNDRNFFTMPHRNWKLLSVALYVHGYLVTCANTFLIVTAQELHQTERLSLFPSSLFHFPRGILGYMYRGIVIILAITLSSAALFTPFAALPLEQQNQYTHQCDTYPMEAIVTAQANCTTETPSIISFSTPIDQEGHDPGERKKLYEFTVYNISDLRVVRLSEIHSGAMPPTTTLFILDGAQRRFASPCPSVGLSSALATSNSSELERAFGDHACTYASGSYGEDPYLTFTFNTTTPNGSKITHLRAEHLEWNFPDDAPALSLRRLVVEDDEGRIGDHVIRTALTKRNHPYIEKVCVNRGVVDTETLAPLSVVLLALEKFSFYISRPKVYT
ncbi:hypothetical protein CC2G_006609 [Coprinopsis cinerea AmutBmut pab1-1]|nr:hypothetical protein CC2G_006609 [Coprinopsis cinerea AmutBmut pab1-1]